MARYPEAEREYEDAFFEAMALRDQSTATFAAVHLTAVVGSSLARRDEGLRWGRQARVLVDLDPAHDDDMAASLEHNSSLVALKAGDYATAIAGFERALALSIRRYGEHSPRVIVVLKSLGAALDGDQQVPRALEHLERARVLSEEIFGPDHPAVGDANNDVAAALLSAQEHSRAVASLERAVEIYEAAALEEKAAVSLDNLALAMYGLDKTTDALAFNARALAIRKRALPASHPAIADTLVNRGSLLDEVGRQSEAVSALTNAIAIYEAILGPQHERVSDAYYNLANTRRGMGEPAEALEAARRALAIRRHELRVGHPKIDQAILMVADAALGAGKPAIAIDELQGALARTGDPPRSARLQAGMLVVLCESLLEIGDAPQAQEVLARLEIDDLPAPDRPRARFLRARASWDTGGDRAAARRLALEAAAELRATAGESVPDLVEIEAWLASHRPD
jgi:tetratricopeptide (TPR) repeat protein